MREYFDPQSECFLDGSSWLRAERNQEKAVDVSVAKSSGIALDQGSRLLFHSLITSCMSMAGCQEGTIVVPAPIILHTPWSSECSICLFWVGIPA